MYIAKSSLIYLLFVFCFFYSELVLATSETKRINAENFSRVSGGIKAEYNSGADGARDIGYIKNGSFACYENITFNGEQKVRFSVASIVLDGSIEVRLDNPKGKLIGTAKIPDTKNWSKFKTTEITIKPVSGTHNLFLVFRGGSGYLMNLDWFEFLGGTVNVHKNSSAKNKTSVNSSTKATERINAEKFSKVLGGIKAEYNSGADGARDIGYIKNNSYACYENITFTGQTKARFSVASKAPGSSIELRLDSPDGKIIGTVKISDTKSWSKFKTNEISINPISGKHSLYLLFRGTDGYLLNLDWFEFLGGKVTAQKNAPAKNKTSVNSSTKATERINAENFSKVSGGIKAEYNSGADGARDIGYIKNGSYACYKNITFKGEQKVRFCVASKALGGSIEVRLDSPDGKRIGTVKILNTKSWSRFEVREINISPIKGTHDLFLVFKGDHGYLMNLDWFEFQ